MFEKKFEAKKIWLASLKYGVHIEDITRLRLELEKAWEALDFYADKKNYEPTFYPLYEDIKEPIFIEGDLGERARKALNDESTVG